MLTHFSPTLNNCFSTNKIISIILITIIGFFIGLAFNSTITPQFSLEIEIKNAVINSASIATSNSVVEELKWGQISPLIMGNSALTEEQKYRYSNALSKAKLSQTGEYILLKLQSSNNLSIQDEANELSKITTDYLNEKYCGIIDFWKSQLKIKSAELSDLQLELKNLNGKNDKYERTLLLTQINLSKKDIAVVESSLLPMKTWPFSYNKLLQREITDLTSLKKKFNLFIFTLIALSLGILLASNSSRLFKQKKSLEEIS